LSRRSAQLTEAIGSWKPEGFREVSLKDSAPTAWNEEKSARLKEFIISAMETMQVPGAAIAIEPGAGRLLRVLSPPSRGGLKLVVNTDVRTLTLDGGQSKYVFQKL
jgi:hypothetical protein